MLGSKQSFLVLRVLPAPAGASGPESAEGLFVNLEGGKRLVPKKFWREKDLRTLVSKIVSGRLNHKVIVAADPSLVSTATVPISSLRERPKEPLTAVELENILAQSAGKVFNQYRLEAAGKLQVDDLDMVLVGGKVSDFHLDGHRVWSPLGFEAKRVAAALELKFTSRVLFEEIKPVKNFFFTDIARAELAVLGKIRNPPLNLVVLDPDRSYFAAPEKCREIRWQTVSLVRAICDAWAVSPRAAEGLYSAYLAGSVSPAVGRTMNRQLQPVVQSLLARIEELRPRGRVFLDSEVQLPLSLPVRKKAFSLEKIELQEIMLKLGLEGTLSFRWLAPLAHFLTDKSDSEINRWLRRHLHWLGSPI